MYTELIQPIPPLVEKVLTKLADGKPLTTDTLRTMKEKFDRLHPWGLASRYDVLVDNSGEELAMQFMSYYNEYAPMTY